MPGIKKYDDYTLYTWKITESRNTLIGLCQSKNLNCSHIHAIKSDKRACEMLAEVLLIHEITGNNTTELHHDEDGAPYINNYKAHISITHSDKIVCIAVSQSCPIGIDIETNVDKIIKVRHKFLSNEELKYIPESDISKNHMAWTAKEAVFKVARIKELSLKDNITLNEDISIASVSFSEKSKTYDITHEYSEDNGFFITVAKPKH